VNVYENNEVLAQYLLFHYGKEKDLFPYDIKLTTAALNFPKQCVEDFVDFKAEKALDLGRSVGRSSFELTKYFNSVTGIDYSQVFINAANEMKEKKSISFQIQIEANNYKELTVKQPIDTDSSKLKFLQGDAQSISSEHFDNDLVIACNLLCRLDEPKKFLSNLNKLVKKGGMLILVSPYSWLTQFTSSTNWLPTKSNTSEEVICSELRGDFNLDKKKDMPFLIREHQRKFQLGVSQALVFIRS